MIAASIIAILAMIALPKFSNLILKSKEAAIKGALGSLRSAVNIYEANNEGNLPAAYGGIRDSLNNILMPDYIDHMPVISIPTFPIHIPSARDYSINNCAGFWNTAAGRNFAWYYYYDPVAAPVFLQGVVYVHCSHTDSNGKVWSTY